MNDEKPMRYNYIFIQPKITAGWLESMDKSMHCQNLSWEAERLDAYAISAGTERLFLMKYYHWWTKGVVVVLVVAVDFVILVL